MEDIKMTDAILTAILGLVGMAVIAVSSVVMALKVGGDRSITWRGFGVSFEIRSCKSCVNGRKSMIKEK